MNSWRAPNFGDLARFAEESRGAVLLCSPFVSKTALDVVLESLRPSDVSSVEVWTRLVPSDYLTGASDPEGLLDFLEQAAELVGPVSLRQSPRLHAKIFTSDGDIGLAGSANLTPGGFGRNHEVVRVAEGDELALLRDFTETLRTRLEPVSLDAFRAYVSRCNELHGSQEALLDLIREEALKSGSITRTLIPYGRFLEFVAEQESSIAREILTIARNIDGNNNTGKIKQAFYGVQRFLQLNPRLISQVASLPDTEWFDVSEGPFDSEWRSFLTAYREEESGEYGYSIGTLVGYLTPTSGGRRTGGGGGDNQLKRVWPFVGRLMRNTP